MTSSFEPLAPRARTLMGPGPSNVHPRVMSALGAPTLGHLDPQFLGYMDELKQLLKTLFRTRNELTFPISGTGSAGMEACLVNVLEPGDRVVIAQNGVFGGRMADIAERIGCHVDKVQAPWGEPIAPERVVEAIGGRATKLVGVVHAETSTGVRQPIEPVAEAAHAVDALCLVDCVTSLGGIDVDVDGWQVDLAYSGTQKCLSCPPGLAPVTFSPRAVDALQRRKSKVPSWYLDASMLLNYWGGERVYHHTAPINMLYALREALLVILDEGIEPTLARHRLHHRALSAGLEAMGLSLPVDPAYRLPQLNAVRIPDGAQDARVRSALLNDFDIEIGAGLGPLKGQVWRIGLMGHTARADNVVLLLGALETVLGSQGAKIARGRALEAAQEVWGGAGA